MVFSKVTCDGQVNTVDFASNASVEFYNKSFKLVNADTSSHLLMLLLGHSFCALYVPLDHRQSGCFNFHE